MKGGAVSFQTVRPWRSLLTVAACPAIVNDPLGLSCWLLWEPASRFPFEPWTPAANSTVRLFSQKVHYTPNTRPPSPPNTHVHCSPAPPSQAHLCTHTQFDTHTLYSLRSPCAVALGWASGQCARFRRECFLDEGPCWSGFCHLSFSLGGRKGRKSGCEWWDWGGEVKFGGWGLNRRDAMAIWHRAGSLLIFQYRLPDFSSCPFSSCSGPFPI